MTSSSQVGFCYNEMGLKSQIKQAMKVLHKTYKLIPPEVIHHAQGFVFMTQIKGGFIYSGTIGQGIIIKRLGPDSWSPPSSIGIASAGIGLQIGAQKTDLVLVLNDDSSMAAFTRRGQLQLGVDYMLSAGPGRTVKADITVSRKGFSGIFIYCKSQGAFAGISLEGAVLSTIPSVNNRFYRGKHKVKDILAGRVTLPDQNKVELVAMLHAALNDAANGKLDGHLTPISRDLSEYYSDDDEEDDTQHTTTSNERPTSTAYGSSRSNSNQNNNLLDLDFDTPAAASPYASQSDTAATGNLLDLNYGSTPSAQAQPSPYGINSPSKRGFNPFDSPLTRQQSSGKDLLVRAISGVNLNSPPAAPQKYQLKQDHFVNDLDQGIKYHNIMSLQQGSIVTIVRGDLVNGLPPPYSDYIEIRAPDGNVGKISKHVLTKV